MGEPTVVQALAAVMSDVQAVRKDGRNQSQNFNFRGIDAVMNAVGPVLRKHGVVVLPAVQSVSHRDVEVGGKRTPMRECTVRVRYRFHGPSGDHLDSEVAAEALDSGDKATAKAMSVAYRTCLLQALTIPTDEPDPDESSYERSAAPEPAPELTEKQQAALDTVKEGLDDEGREQVKSWMNERGMPLKFGLLSDDDADAVREFAEGLVPF